MTAIPSGSWRYTYDAASHVQPTTTGSMYITPDPLGTIVGDLLHLAPNSYFIDWFGGTDVRSLAVDLFDVTNAVAAPNYAIAIAVSEGNYAAFIIIKENAIGYTTNAYTLTPFVSVAAIDFTAPRRIYAVMHGTVFNIIIDGVEYGAFPAIDLGAPVQQGILVAYNDADLGMLSVSVNAETYDGPDAGGVLPTSISLGGNGIAFDLDEFALYGAPLTATQVHILDAAGRGVPR